MTETIVRPKAPARRGHDRVNAELDETISETSHLTTDELAELLTIDTVTGHPNTPLSGPVGRWVLGELQSHGHPAVTYSWGSTFAVYDAALRLIGEVTIPQSHTLYLLDCEVNDGDRPELTWQGEGDQR